MYSNLFMWVTLRVRKESAFDNDRCVIVIVFWYNFVAVDYKAYCAALKYKTSYSQ